MEKDKHVIWNNDSLAHDGYEEGIKEDWIQSFSPSSNLIAVALMAMATPIKVLQCSTIIIPIA